MADALTMSPARERQESTGGRPEQKRPGSTALSVTVIVLACNEELHLERCLANVAGWAESMIVAASFSTDRTVDIARRFGAQLQRRPFKHQAEQFQWALDHCEVTTEWVLRLDADEYLEEALKAEIAQRLPGLPPEVTGVILKRKVIFRDNWIRHGGYYPASFLRLWRRGAACIEQRWMDEHAILLHGRSVTMAHDFVDHNLRDITWWIDKHNRYATRQMVDFIGLEHALFSIDDRVKTHGDAKTRRKRALRNRVFGNAPLYLRSVLYFLYRYFLRLGVLDGKQGFVFHYLHGFWSFLLMDINIQEPRHHISLHGINAFRQYLARHHNIEL